MEEQPNIPNNAEIDSALKEFEAKSNQEHPIQGTITPQQNLETHSEEVEGVKFETEGVESYSAIKFYKETIEPKMVKAVIKYSGGAVKNQKQAEWFLFGFVVVAIGISIYLLLSGTNSNKAYLEEQQKLYPPGSSVLR
jgi:hypothetical protein